MEDCIFCKIVAGDIPSEKIYVDDKVSAFYDINPAAPVHVLIVPNTHIPMVNSLTEDHAELAGHMILVAKQIAGEEGIQESGYRLIINNGAHGGQEVFHLHLHLLGGQRMRHPMG
ncbi:MAG: HIT domain-containing protein [Gammaproteobacteria bacterium]|nr:HIT domain-containing protein [Gammaproteobacteria bacterium]